MPFGLSSCNCIPDAGCRCWEGIKGDEGTCNVVAELDLKGDGASQDACLVVVIGFNTGELGIQRRKCVPGLDEGRLFVEEDWGWPFV